MAMSALTREQMDYALAVLRRVVEARAIKQWALANDAGVTQSTVSKVLSENHDGPMPSEDSVRKLFAAVGLNFNNILVEINRAPGEISGYLATPLTGLSVEADAGLRRLVERIRRLAAAAGVNEPKFSIYWPGDHTHPRTHADTASETVYVTDRSRASTPDFIILLCVAPSYGVGQENEIATQAGIDALRLVPAEGLSRMMIGSFLRSFDITYNGTLETELLFDEAAFLARMREIRTDYFRRRAWTPNSRDDAFGSRLKELILDRCGEDLDGFARDVGISRRYLDHLLGDSFIVANPSARLLQLVANRLGETVGFLLGERGETDPVLIESLASWRKWIESSPSIDARTATLLREEWLEEYHAQKRICEPDTVSYRASSRTSVMRAVDWDKRFQAKRNSVGQAELL